MPIRAALRPPRPAGGAVRRRRLRRALLATAALAAAPAAMTWSPPATAQISAERAAAPAGGGEQSYTAPADVDPPRPVRELEMTIVAPREPEWVLPAAGALRDGFGPRPDAPVPGVSAYHRGQDIGAPCGAQVRAAASGEVVQAGWDGSYGNWILLQHADGVQTGYAHAERLLVRVGQRVRVGAVIAVAGSTGASSGCHVHFEVREKDRAVDPVPFMRERGVRLGTSRASR